MLTLKAIFWYFLKSFHQCKSVCNDIEKTRRGRARERERERASEAGKIWKIYVM